MQDRIVRLPVDRRGVFDLVNQSIHAQLVFRDGVAAIVDAGVQVYLGLQGRQIRLSA